MEKFQTATVVFLLFSAAFFISACEDSSTGASSNSCTEETCDDSKENSSESKKNERTPEESSDSFIRSSDSREANSSSANSSSSDSTSQSDPEKKNSGGMCNETNVDEILDLNGTNYICLSNGRLRMINHADTLYGICTSERFREITHIVDSTGFTLLLHTELWMGECCQCNTQSE